MLPTNLIQEGSITNIAAPKLSYLTDNVARLSGEFVLPVKSTDKKPGGDGGMWVKSGDTSQLSGSFSSHLLNNGETGYWSSIYNGEITSNISLTVNEAEFIYWINYLPRNLNGYTVSIISSNRLSGLLTIKKFYNGVINLTFTTEHAISINDNNCIINFNNCNIKNTITANNNVNLSFKFSTLSTPIFSGKNNKISLSGQIPSALTFNEFSGNYIQFLSTPASSVLNDINDNMLNNKLNNNNIQINGYTETPNYYDNLINHTHKNLDNFVKSEYFSITDHIDKVIPFIKRDLDIGTIIGWPQYNTDGKGKWLPKIPYGFYNCSIAADNPLSSMIIPIDTFDPTDKWYNGELANLIEKNINTNTFTIPEIPAVMVNNQRLVYIIKYNSNFEHNFSDYMLNNEVY